MEKSTLLIQKIFTRSLLFRTHSFLSLTVEKQGPKPINFDFLIPDSSLYFPEQASNVGSLHKR